MMEGDCWLAKTSERDPLVPFLSNIVLTVTPTGGRAQAQVQHRPSMLKMTSSTTTPSRARKSTGNALKVAMQCNTSSTRPFVMRQAPCQERLAKDHPKDPIPPKPPYSDNLNKPMLAARSPPRFGKKKEIQSPPCTEAQPIKPSINWLFNSRIPVATPHQNTMTKTVPK